MLLQDRCVSYSYIVYRSDKFCVYLLKKTLLSITNKHTFFGEIFPSEKIGFKVMNWNKKGVKEDSLERTDMIRLLKCLETVKIV